MNWSLLSRKLRTLHCIEIRCMSFINQVLKYALWSTVDIAAFSLGRVAKSFQKHLAVLQLAPTTNWPFTILDLKAMTFGKLPLCRLATLDESARFTLGKMEFRLVYISLELPWVRGGVAEAEEKRVAGVLMRMRDCCGSTGAVRMGRASGILRWQGCVGKTKYYADISSV
jgi:hypothetical protein